MSSEGKVATLRPVESETMTDEQMAATVPLLEKFLEDVKAGRIRDLALVYRDQQRYSEVITTSADRVVTAGLLSRALVDIWTDD